METILDLQTCKIIDTVVEKTMTISWLRHGLSYDNQILGRTSVCQVSFSQFSGNIVFRRWRERGGGGGGVHSFSVTESQKSSANPGGTTVYD